MDEWCDTPGDRQRMAWLVADLDPKHIDIHSRIHKEPNGPTSELLSNAGYPDCAKASGVIRSITSDFVDWDAVDAGGHSARTWTRPYSVQASDQPFTSTRSCRAWWSLTRHAGPRPRLLDS